MADPISVAASILGVASAGIKLSSALYCYTETVINADKNIREIARDLSITSSVVTELGMLLGQDDQSQFHSEALVTARDAVRSCEEVFKEIQRELDKSLDFDSKGKTPMTHLRRLKWPLVQPKLNVLQLRLERLKNTLVLVLNVVSYARGAPRFDNASGQQPFPFAIQRCQIERLISLTEQANERSQSVEMMVRRLGLTNGSTESPGLSPDEKIWDKSTSQGPRYPRLLLPEPTICAIDDENVPSVSRTTGSCICGNPTAPLEENPLHISRQDLDHCVKHVRALLKVVEDAQSVSNGAARCENITATLKSSLKTLHGFLPREPKRSGRLTRLFSRARSRNHRLENLSPNDTAVTGRKGVSNAVCAPPALSNPTLRASTTLPPEYEEILSSVRSIRLGIKEEESFPRRSHDHKLNDIQT